MTEHQSHTPEGMIEERDENAIMAERRSKLTALREQVLDIVLQQSGVIKAYNVLSQMQQQSIILVCYMFQLIRYLMENREITVKKASHIR